MIKINDVDAATFDFCGTLDADGIPWWRRMYKLLSDQCHASIDEDAYRNLYHRIDNHIQELLSGKEVSIEECVTEHLGTQVNELKVSLSKPLIVNLAHEFAQDVDKAVQHHLHTLICLREQGLRLAIISNGYGSMSKWCEHLGLSKLIDVIIDSSIVGVRKPHVKIFEIAIGKLGVEKNRILHVGDNLQTDILGANKVGIQSVWVRRPKERVPNTTDRRPTYIIECVNELLEMVR